MNQKPESLSRKFYDLYDGERSYKECFDEYFDAEYTVDMIEIVWGATPPYRLLDAGSASGLTLAAFERVNVEAWGVENNAYIHSQTTPEWKHRNLRADVCNLPFEDNFFDFVYDTCLCHLREEDLNLALRELHRVTRHGILFSSITSDVSPQTRLNNNYLFLGLKTLNTTREWSQRFLSNGFRLAVVDDRVLEDVWRCDIEADEGEPWYSSRESMRYCFYTKK